MLIAEIPVIAESQLTNPSLTPNTHPPIIINSDGSVSPSTAPIKQTGNSYTLTDSVTGAIEIKRNNTIIDGNGFTVSGWGNGFGGIDLFLVRNVILENFVISNLQSGIRLTYAENCIVINNTVKSGVSWLQHTAAIYVEAGSSNIIAKNNLVNNVNATYFVSTTNNIIVANNIIDSSGVACLLYDSSNNTFYHNNFVNNRLQVLDIRESNYPFVVPQSINTWDNGSVGNYWSDYNGANTNNDGIGDSPYGINANNKDNYPLLSQFNIKSEIVELPTSGEMSTPTSSPTTLPTINTGPEPPKTEPFPTTLDVVSIASIAVIGIGLLVYFKKRKGDQKA
jgi:parallel beta-helix repeat protein